MERASCSNQPQTLVALSREDPGKLAGVGVKGEEALVEKRIHTAVDNHFCLARGRKQVIEILNRMVNGLSWNIESTFNFSSLGLLASSETSIAKV